MSNKGKAWKVVGVRGKEIIIQESGGGRNLSIEAGEKCIRRISCGLLGDPQSTIAKINELVHYTTKHTIEWLGGKIEYIFLRKAGESLIADFYITIAAETIVAESSYEEALVFAVYNGTPLHCSGEILSGSVVQNNLRHEELERFKKGPFGLFIDWLDI